MKPLTVQEWLEAERLSGLPHADFAAEALAGLQELADIRGVVEAADLEPWGDLPVLLRMFLPVGN